MYQLLEKKKKKPEGRISLHKIWTLKLIFFKSIFNCFYYLLIQVWDDYHNHPEVCLEFL